MAGAPCISRRSRRSADRPCLSSRSMRAICAAPWSSDGTARAQHAPVRWRFARRARDLRRGGAHSSANQQTQRRPQGPWLGSVILAHGFQPALSQLPFFRARHYGRLTRQSRPAASTRASSALPPAPSFTRSRLQMVSCRSLKGIQFRRRHAGVAQHHAGGAGRLRGTDNSWRAASLRRASAVLSPARWKFPP